MRSYRLFWDSVYIYSYVGYVNSYCLGKYSMDSLLRVVMKKYDHLYFTSRGFCAERVGGEQKSPTKEQTNKGGIVTHRKEDDYQQRTISEGF